ncbi:MAG TPA: sigma-70 family RNA polymerase sigma factor [Xanthomonadaceae bacterium]|nr:sigma-70 family RNA polymerase sigma factor [Xanthomonadaceae bacterium]
MSAAPSPFAIDVPESLLARARGGELRAFEQLYRLFERPVYTVALRLLGDADEAQEVLHEAMLKVLENIREYRADAPFWGWLRRIAVNEALMRLRKGRRLDYVDETPEPGEDAVQHGMLPPVAADAACLIEAMTSLPETTRTVLWLFHAEGYTHEEIAALMGRTASFSKSQVARGTRRLQVLLSDEPRVSTYA